MKGKTLKVLSVSDVVQPIVFERANTAPLADVDLVLSCGDLPPEYLSRLVNSFNAPLFYVRGNHDIRYLEKPPEGGRNLHRRLEKINGINILGLEGSRWYNGGPIQYEEWRMRSIIRRLRPTLWWRGGVEVVITHAPPRFIHDAEDPCHKGFKSFRQLIEKYQPAYLIHGHIHREFSDPADRITTLGRTQVVNTYGYCLLEIENRSADE
ncbi:MAG: metallophosphoesterase [Desulfobacterales bacterium]|jgi:Icc-related predicted phosphoesterase